MITCKLLLHRFIFFTLLIIIYAQSTFSQAWLNHYGSSGDDKAYAIAVDKFGDIYLTGYISTNSNGTDFCTIKFTSSGIQKWVKTYNGPGNGDDKAYAISVDKSSNIIVTGFSTGVGSGHDFTTIKYSSDGIQMWVQRYNSLFNNDDEAQALICDDSANIYVTGFVTSVGTDYYTIKYNSNGQYQWGQCYSGFGTGDDKAYAITLDRSANIYITGWARDSHESYNYTTIKYNLNGSQQWVALYNGNGNGENKAYAITIDRAGFIYITGYSKGQGNRYDFATVKYDSSGNQRWNARFNGSGNSDDKAYAITVDSLNNIYVTGSSIENSDSGIEYFVTIKYNGIDTSALWVSNYPVTGNGSSIPYDIYIPKNNSAVFVAGSSWSNNVNKNDIAIVKYNLNDGTQLQERKINGNGNSDDAAYAIIVDSLGNLFVAGYAAISGNGNDIVTMKFERGDLIGVNTISTNVPKNFVLFQNYPNPFNPTTNIRFEIASSSFVRLKVYDLLGQEIAVLVDKYLHAGVYESEFNIPNLSSGVYFYELTTDTYRDIKKMVLIK